MKSTRNKSGTFLTFGSFYVYLDFTCNFLGKFYNHYCPSEESKMTREEGVSQLSFLVICLLQSIYEMDSLSAQENILVKNPFALSVSTRSSWTSEHPQLLLKACAISCTPTATFKVILQPLDAGADPNSMKDNQRSPLHLLAMNECALAPWRDRVDWDNCRSKLSTSVVQAFLNSC